MIEWIEFGVGYALGRVLIAALILTVLVLLAAIYILGTSMIDMLRIRWRRWRHK